MTHRLIGSSGHAIVWGLSVASDGDFFLALDNEEHLESNINQAARLWAASGRSEQTFCQLLFEAASTARKRGGVRNRMAYYLRVLRDLLGIHSDRSL